MTNNTVSASVESKMLTTFLELNTHKKFFVSSYGIKVV